MKKFVCSLLVLIVLVFSFCTACSNKEKLTPSGDYPQAEIEIQNYGVVTVELYDDIAPLTVEHFMRLAENGAYNNSKIIRLQSDFVLQGGAGAQDESTVKGEFRANGVNNSLSHTKGVLSLARSEENDSGSSQFFIVLSDSYATSLDGKYAGFGKVIGGWKVIEKICKDFNSSWLDNGYYGAQMGFFNQNSYLTISEIRVIKN